MESTAKPKNRFPDAVWRQIEQRACAGHTLQILSDAYGIGIATLNDRSKRYDWKTPARLARRLKAALSEEKTSIAKSEIRGHSLASESALADACAALIAVADSSPVDFQAAFAKVAQHALACGIGVVPQPRTVAELKTWADIHRRAAGLDTSDGNRGNLPLINPLRSVSRRPVVVVDVVTSASGTPRPEAEIS